jgi:AraC-like DNA-binding protein
MLYRFDVPQFLDWIVQSWAPVALMAEHAAYSRSHFCRRLTRIIGESPNDLRRRLRLEAGAHMLRRTSWSIGEIAFEVGYQSPEAFTKAFVRAFGASPRAFRCGTGVPLLESRSGIHFHPSGIIARRQGDYKMTLTQLLFRHHIDELGSLLAAAAKLDDRQLDEETLAEGDEIPFDQHDRTIRGVLEAIVYTQEVWLAAFSASETPVPKKGSVIERLQERHATSAAGLSRFVEEFEAKGLWQSEFVDALCCPPERFTFGGVVAHILVFSAHRRQMALAAFRKLGVDDLGYGDPLVWLRSQG